MMKKTYSEEATFKLSLKEFGSIKIVIAISFPLR